MKRLLTLLITVLCVSGLAFSDELSTVFENGVSTDLTGAGRTLLVPNPHRVQLDALEFHDYATTDFTIVEQVGGSAHTEALTAGDGGLIAISNVSGTTGCELLFRKESFPPESTKEMWFSFRGKINTITDGRLTCGLALPHDDVCLATTGMFFESDVSTGTIDFHVGNYYGATQVTTTVSSVGTLAADTYKRLDFWYNGKASGDGGEVQVFVDGVHVGTAGVTNMPTEELSLFMGVGSTGGSAGKTLTADWLTAGKERLIGR